MILQKQSLLQFQLLKEFISKLRQSDHHALIRVAAATTVLGLALRIALVLLAGNRSVGPFSGVGDQIRYQTLADSIFQGAGFTYAGQPTALRPPLYPILLATLHLIFGSHYLLVTRVLQLLSGIGLAYVCSLLASELFSVEAGAMAGALALALPSLIFITAEVQTEGLAAFVTALFLYFLLRGTERGRKGAVGMGISSGVAMLIRFNSAILPIIGAIVCSWFRRNVKHSLEICSLAALIVAPWIVRNAIVFHGKVIYSSHSGINLLEGVLTPEGRAQKGENERLRTAVGWSHTDIELNSPHRLQFPSEDELDKQARNAAIVAWGSLDLRSRLQVLTKKIASFWLSTDQLLETSSFSSAQRVLRAASVVGYWAVLILTLVGWLYLLSFSRGAASAIAFYAVFVTSAHLPFVMNTRLRIPLLDPLLVVLAAGGLCFLADKYRGRWGGRLSSLDSSAKCVPP